MMSTATYASQNYKRLAKKTEPSPMAQLLHALNQPLTGLQCSMEVALARRRTNQEYAQGLRAGLELTERMRALVEAMRDVAEIDEEDIEKESLEFDAAALESLLREAVADLRPVAEVKEVRIEGDLSVGVSLAVRKQPLLSRVIFRLLDSTLSMAASGSVLRIETGLVRNRVRLRIQWRGEAPRTTLARPELGLLVARAWLERSGAEWERKRAEGMETLNIRLRCVS